MKKTALINQQWRMWGMWEPKMFLQRRGDGAVMDVDVLWDECHQIIQTDYPNWLSQSDSQSTLGVSGVVNRNYMG